MQGKEQNEGKGNEQIETGDGSSDTSVTSVTVDPELTFDAPADAPPPQGPGSGPGGTP